MGSCCSAPENDNAVKMNRVNSKYAEPNRTLNLPSAPSELPQAHVIGGDNGQTSSGGQSENDRLARLQAAEKRAQESKNRGVKNGGGQLSNKLAEERGKKQAPQHREEVNQLDWRAD